MPMPGRSPTGPAAPPGWISSPKIRARARTPRSASKSWIRRLPRSPTTSRRRSSRAWRPCWRRRASPTTSPLIAMRRRDCASGAARPWRRRTSRRSPPGSIGRSRKPEPRCPRRPDRFLALPKRLPVHSGAPDMAPKVLISDKLSAAAVQIFQERGVEADIKLGLDKEELARTIENYDGLAIRSATKVTEKVLDRAKKLRVIGRAGIGVDNVDLAAATARGIIVMNTPFGNSITTAEHTITLMLALARQIPAADASTQAGKWEKNRFLGVEITGKTLGIIGCGNIGSIVADRAHGLKMKVIAYDPYLSPEHAVDIGVEKVDLEELLRRADFISLHTPPPSAACASSIAPAAVWSTRQHCGPRWIRDRWPGRRSTSFPWNRRWTT